MKFHADLIAAVARLGARLEQLIGIVDAMQLNPGLDLAVNHHLPPDLRALYAWRNGQSNDAMILPFHFFSFECANRGAEEFRDIIPELGERKVFLIGNSWGNGVMLACPHQGGTAVGTYTFDGQVCAEHDSVVAMLQAWVSQLELHASSRQRILAKELARIAQSHSPRAGDYWDSIDDWRNHYWTRTGRRVEYDDQAAMVRRTRIVAKNNTFKLLGCRFRCPADLRGQVVQLQYCDSLPHRIWVYHQGKSLGEAQPVALSSINLPDSLGP